MFWQNSTASPWQQDMKKAPDLTWRELMYKYLIFRQTHTVDGIYIYIYVYKYIYIS